MSAECKTEMSTVQYNTSLGYTPPDDEGSETFDLEIKQSCSSIRDDNDMMIKIERDVDDVPNVLNVQRFPYQCRMKQSKPCPICNKKIGSYSFQRHLGTHNGDRYQCPRCPKTFSQAGYTRIHLITSHQEDKLNVDKMEIKLITKKSYDDVMEGIVKKPEKMVTEIPDYKRCSICTKYVALSRFKGHLDKHMGVGYQYPRCPKTFSNAGNTRNHLVRSHQEDKLSASLVEIKSMRPNGRIRRPRSTKGYKQCPICNKGIYPPNLQKHLDKHNGIRYQCPRCPNTFCNVTNTRRHLEYYHEEIVDIGLTKENTVTLAVNDKTVIKIEKDDKIQNPLP